MEDEEDEEDEEEEGRNRRGGGERKVYTCNEFVGYAQKNHQQQKRTHCKATHKLTFIPLLTPLLLLFSYLLRLLPSLVLLNSAPSGL